MFKRARTKDSGDPLADFWRWWQSEGAEGFAHAIGSGGKFGKLPDRITERVTAIHPDLVWELAPGQVSQHALCVSAGGDWRARPTAERWLKSAPPPDGVWEYISARRADPDVAEHSLTFAGTEVLVGDMRLRLDIDEGRQLINVGCFHPRFPELPDGAREQLKFLVLDWTLGEDEVERWVGTIEALEETPADGLPLDALPEAVRALAARQDEDGWVVLEGTTPVGTLLLISVRRPLRWIDYPLYDRHLAFTVSFDTARDDGMPEADALDRLRALEDDLVDRLEGRALLIAHETAEGIRTFRLYADSEDESVIADSRAWASEHSATFTGTLDPGWRAVQRYR